jgi:hypothetical protein
LECGSLLPPSFFFDAGQRRKQGCALQMVCRGMQISLECSSLLPPSFFCDAGQRRKQACALQMVWRGMQISLECGSLLPPSFFVMQDKGASKLAHSKWRPFTPSHDE